MKKHTGAIIVFFVFYFWIQALANADTHLEWNCDENTNMVFDSDIRTPGCDKVPEDIGPISQPTDPILTV